VIRQARFLVVAALLAFAAGFTLEAFAQEEKTFDFTAPTQWTDGSPLTLAQITRHVLACNPMPAGVEPVVAASANTFTRRFPPGTYSCTLQTRATMGADSESQISDPSNTVTFTVSQPILKPRTPVLSVR